MALANVADRIRGQMGGRGFWHHAGQQRGGGMQAGRGGA
jgi:hypothetical protein